MPGMDPGRFLRRLDFIKLPYLLFTFGKTGLSKQCRTRSDAAFWSTLFATYSAILHTSMGSKMGDEEKYKVMSKGCELFICVEILQPSQPNGVMPSAVSLPIHTFTRQA